MVCGGSGGGGIGSSQMEWIVIKSFIAMNWKLYFRERSAEVHIF